MSNSSIQNVLNKLGLSKENGLYHKGDIIDNITLRMKNSLAHIDYDAVFLLHGNPIIIFKEFNTINEYNENSSVLNRDVWNLGEVPILFLILPDQIFVYNANLFDENKSNLLKSFTVDDEEIENFEYSNLISGKIWNTYQKDFEKGKSFQDELLFNLKYVRKHLLEKYFSENEELGYKLIHNLIGRVLFSRYLVDRNVLTSTFFIKNYELGFDELFSNKKKLYEFFDYLEENFNGDLFPLVENEYDLVNVDILKIVFGLFKGNSLKTGQTVLINKYNFKIIPIELISNIYEAFLNKNNKKTASYYTPLFLVDYVLYNTLDEILKKKNSCKTLDPSCGSGVFLVESLRRIIEKQTENYDELSKNDLIRILTENIFGIDIDRDAVNISIFSLCITLLDYLEPKDIINFKFPKLIGENFWVDDFFNTNSDFEERHDFELIVGNPPWNSNNKNKLYKDYLETNDIPGLDNGIAHAFLVRVNDFINEDSKVALLVLSKILYNTNSKMFREYFLNEYYLEEVLDCSPVRKYLFKNAVAPAVALFYNKSNDNDKEHYVQHTSLKANRLFFLLSSVVIENFDIKYIPQKEFIENDWLWKSLLYGSFLDVNLIKKLKTYQNIKKYVEKNSFKDGVGVTVWKSNTKYEVPEYIGKNFLDVSHSKKMLKRYWINDENVKKWDVLKVHAKRNPELFKPPYVLIKEGPDSDFQPISTYSDKEWIFKKSVYAIKGTNKDEKPLKNIVGILNSKLCAYYTYLTASSLGTERERVEKTEFFDAPFIEDKEIVVFTDKLLKIDRKK